MNRAGVFIVPRPEGQCVLVYGLATFGMLVEGDSVVLTLEQLSDFTTEIDGALLMETAGTLSDNWHIHETQYGVEYDGTGAWWLRIGDTMQACDSEYITGMVKMIRQYLDTQMVTESNATEALKALKDAYQPEAG